MVRMRFSIQLHYRIEAQPADFTFNIHAAHTPRQVVVSENLQITPYFTPSIESDPVTGSRYVRLRAGPGDLRVRFRAVVDIANHVGVPSNLNEVPVANLPRSVLPYLYPSRYCQSDRRGAALRTHTHRYRAGRGRRVFCHALRIGRLGSAAHLDRCARRSGQRIRASAKVG